MKDQLTELEVVIRLFLEGQFITRKNFIDEQHPTKECYMVATRHNEAGGYYYLLTPGQVPLRTNNISARGRLEKLYDNENFMLEGRIDETYGYLQSIVWI